MTTAKPRYEPQICEQVFDVSFDEAQLALLRSIKDDDSFVDAIRHIATLYGCFSRSEPEDLSAGEFRATLDDLRQRSCALQKKLENIPQSVDVALWRFSYRHGSERKMENLKRLLTHLTDEIERVLDEQSNGRPGRKPAVANRHAAGLLIQCFGSFDLPITINQWEHSDPSPLTQCLELIFLSAGKILSRSAIEEYLKQ